mmetsp:Transcript_30100/g.66623  ORF Transcript_30100/g.66623 Transcript_30100/m.66623 type:complete len:367 (-) Transcript_30100:107-1207(-)|eukprot:CAMPEP_0173203474 /NCGR_PEP_ID=MMETSP1141-20130122/19537_1 /TAXON_ID=483371 /ORGANISM="non described non described, Strain CCMP2298" /LENGTH=366 /DNA_ID=CAMNT_0014128931 /DNA_START=58 /DNA_END=1158 /DNA_ORIENTATION=+
MFWSSSKSKKKEDDRDKQVKDLKSVFPSIRRPNNDDSLFEIKFVVDNQYSSLRVFIPADFPSTRPVLQAAGPVTHPWLDQFKQVNGSEKLMNWSKHSSLVEVVEESLAALLAGSNAPTNIPGAVRNGSFTGPARSSSEYSYSQQQHGQHGQGQPPLGHAQSMPQSSSGGAPSDGNSSGRDVDIATAQMSLDAVEPPTMRGISMPSLPSSFPELETLTVTQLERLLSDEVSLEAQLSKVESINSMQTLIDQIKASNEEKARKTLKLEADVHAARRTAEAQQAELQQAIHAYSNQLSKAHSKHSVTRQEVDKELKKTKRELDDSSEIVGRSFVAGDLDLNSFTSDYLEKRQSYHELAAKMSVLARPPR